MTDIVSLARVNSLEQARVIEGLLEANGVPVCLGEAEMAMQSWDYMINNGIRILVPLDCHEEARAIVMEAEAVAALSLEAEFGALEPPIQRRDRWVAWAYLVLSFSMWVFLPVYAVILWIESKRHRPRDKSPHTSSIA